MAEDVNNAFGINFNPTATTTTVHKTDPSNEELVSATNGEKEGKKLPENDGEMEITNYTAKSTSSNSNSKDENNDEDDDNDDADEIVDGMEGSEGMEEMESNSTCSTNADGHAKIADGTKANDGTCSTDTDIAETAEGADRGKIAEGSEVSEGKIAEGSEVSEGTIAGACTRSTEDKSIDYNYIPLSLIITREEEKRRKQGTDVIAEGTDDVVGINEDPHMNP